MLEVDSIDAFYGEFQVLKNVSMRVGEGELHILLGPNGHGRSTLLKTICGLIQPTSGTIYFEGQPIHRLACEKIVEMGITYIAEDRELFPQMTVLENLKMGAHNRNARAHEKESLEYVLDLFPRLTERIKSFASNLSGGEARMLAIARGLMSKARFLAIDEPSLGLSPLFRNEVFKNIEKIYKSGIGVLLVEQNMPQLANMADRIYLMEEGQIVFSGNRTEAENDPVFREVFLGM